MRGGISVIVILDYLGVIYSYYRVKFFDNDYCVIVFIRMNF